MSVFRINKNSNYTVMSNYHFKEKDMSLKAKGLLSLMLSLPQDWNYSIAGLVQICKENESAIKTTLKELQEFGYLKITKLMPCKESGRARIEYIYDIFEQPQEDEKQEVENLPLENQAVENQRQLNTNNKITNNISKKERNKDELEIENDVQTQKNKNYNRESFDEIIERYMRYLDNDFIISNLLKEFLRMRYLKNKPLTNEVLSEEISKLIDYGKGNKYLMREIASKTISNCWATFFPLSDEEEQRIIEEYSE